MITSDDNYDKNSIMILLYLIRHDDDIDNNNSNSNNSNNNDNNNNSSYVDSNNYDNNNNADTYNNYTYHDGNDKRVMMTAVTTLLMKIKINQLYMWNKSMLAIREYWLSITNLFEIYTQLAVTMMAHRMLIAHFVITLYLLMKSTYS